MTLICVLADNKKTLEESLDDIIIFGKTVGISGNIQIIAATYDNGMTKLRNNHSRYACLIYDIVPFEDIFGLGAPIIVVEMSQAQTLTCKMFNEQPTRVLARGRAVAIPGVLGR